MSIPDLAIILSTTDFTDKSASAPSTPTETPKLLHGGSLDMITKGKGRKVTFPDDDLIVSGYLDPPEPWVKVSETDSVVNAYKVACAKHGVKPVSRVLQQVQGIKEFYDRETDLNLNGERLDPYHCETLEEIFKRIQFNKLDFEACHLDDESAAALFDMIDYYESCRQLNISFNKNIDYRGWQACARMLKKASCLSYLDARNTGQNDQSLLILGRALRTGNSLVTLHLENCGLTGRPLVILVAAIKLNNTLQELYLGENKILAADGIQLGNLLQSNSCLELLDLRNNNLQDLGICHLSDGLCQQIINDGEGLKTLVLWNNHLTHIGMQHVNCILLSTRSIETLNLGQNAVGNEGIHQLKQGLIHNQTMKRLGLQNSKITCEGSVALAEYIADNQHINRIDLKENNIQIAGLMALALSLKHNHSVTHLDMDSCNEDSSKAPDGVQDQQKLLQEIASYCRRNEAANNEYSGEEYLKNDVPLFARRKNSAPMDIVSPKHEIPISTEEESPALSFNIQSSPLLQNSQPSPVGSPSPSSRFRVSRVILENNTTENVSPPSPDSPINDAARQMENISISSSTSTIKSKFQMPNGVVLLKNSNLNEQEKVRRSQSLVPEMEQGHNFRSANGTERKTENSVNSNSRLFSHRFTVAEVTFNGSKDTSELRSIMVKKKPNVSEQELTNNAINRENKRDIIKLENKGRSYSDVNHRFRVKKVIDFEGLASTNVEEQKDKTEIISSQKKISFLLPEIPFDSIPNMYLDRRMSSPAVPVAARKKIQRPSALNLKLGRQLESLDLRSSVPLSPTRLLEGFAFPMPPIDIKLPPDNESHLIGNRRL